MKISELIQALNEAKKENGDMVVNVIVDGIICDDICINCPDSESPLYIEGYASY